MERAGFEPAASDLQTQPIARPHLTQTFEDGASLFEAVCERELEGIVAKRVDGSYRSGEPGWTKIKNRDYWRYALERESAINKRRPRVFV
jgi:ATP-dependent DNA ligase